MIHLVLILFVDPSILVSSSLCPSLSLLVFACSANHFIRDVLRILVDSSMPSSIHFQSDVEPRRRSIVCTPLETELMVISNGKDFARAILFEHPAMIAAQTR